MYRREARASSQSRGQSLRVSKINERGTSPGSLTIMDRQYHRPRHADPHTHLCPGLTVGPRGRRIGGWVCGHGQVRLRMETAVPWMAGVSFRVTIGVRPLVGRV